MASQAEVVKLDDAGKLPAEIAKQLGISVNGVYNHLRRAGRAKGGAKTPVKAATGRTRAKAKAALLAATTPERAPAPEMNDLVGNHRSGIADTIEFLEGQIDLRHAEIGALQDQRAPLAKALEALK